VLGYVRSIDGVLDAELAGEVRRRLEVVSALDIVTAAEPSQCDVILAAFRELPGTRRAELERGAEACVQLADGLLLRLRCVPRAEFATALLHATGSESHVQALHDRAVAHGLTIAPEGLRKGRRALAVATETEAYAALGLQYVAPELREDATWLRAEGDDPLPELIRLEDLRGCFHCHTTASDGTATVAEMAAAARARGWRYLGIADHSPAAFYAGGLSVDGLLAQHAEIDAWNAARGDEVWLFKGIEADILADGRIDLAETGVLARCDYVVASVHSQFRMSREQMTARVLRALEDPYITILGHATGRLLLHRDGYALDVAAVLAHAARHGVLVEINADPHRLDLDWRHWTLGRSLGVRTAINPDAHSTRGLGAVEYGVYMARKGGLGPRDVLNAWPLEEVQRYLQARRS
jgi:DNA polymerase (family 10)